MHLQESIVSTVFSVIYFENDKIKTFFIIYYFLGCLRLRFNYFGQLPGKLKNKWLDYNISGRYLNKNASVTKHLGIGNRKYVCFIFFISTCTRRSLVTVGTSWPMLPLQRCQLYKMIPDSASQDKRSSSWLLLIPFTNIDSQSN